MPTVSGSSVREERYLAYSELLSGSEDVRFLGEENEWLVQYAKRKLAEKHRDYFVFGHRHLPLEIALSNDSTYVNLGDWITYFSYGVFDGQQMRLEYFRQ